MERTGVDSAALAALCEADVDEDEDEDENEDAEEGDDAEDGGTGEKACLSWRRSDALGASVTASAAAGKSPPATLPTPAVDNVVLTCGCAAIAALLPTLLLPPPDNIECECDASTDGADEAGAPSGAPNRPFRRLIAWSASSDRISCRNSAGTG